ncbi:MAG: hypothetical protein HKN96_02710 [Flavobacteriaceae bacterium]|nr:hypothetical protein [Bacteroidia bacterium]NND10097.1 hypothetical protein [Flavobacteriaceae bacterium]
MTGYELSRAWFDFAYEHTDVRPSHHALYFHTVETCNRLGWKETFDLPTAYSMEMLGISNYRTYKKALEDLIQWGFIRMVRRSKNQHRANVVALVKNTNAVYDATTKALSLQNRSSASKTKPLNNKLLKRKKLTEITISELPASFKNLFDLAIRIQKVILKNLSDAGAPIKKIEDATAYSFLNPLRLAIENDGATLGQLERATEALDSSGPNFWKQHVISSAKLREKLSQILSDINTNTKNSEPKSAMDEAVAQNLNRYE